MLSIIIIVAIWGMTLTIDTTYYLVITAIVIIGITNLGICTVNREEGAITVVLIATAKAGKIMATPRVFPHVEVITTIGDIDMANIAIIMPEDKLETVLSLLNMDDKSYQEVVTFIEEKCRGSRARSRREQFEQGLLDSMYPGRNELFVLIRNHLLDSCPSMFVTEDKCYQKGYRCPHRHGIYGQKHMGRRFKKQKPMQHRRIYRVQRIA